MHRLLIPLLFCRPCDRYHCPSGAQGFGCSPTDMEWAFILDNVIVAVFNVEILLKCALILPAADSDPVCSMLEIQRRCSFRCSQYTYFFFL